MDSLCDTSCADIIGRILEAFGPMLRIRAKGLPQNGDQDADQDRERKPFPAGLQGACFRAIGYLAATQEADGSWFGRWGCNYIYGTGHAPCGLAYFVAEDTVPGLVRPALEWLILRQHDGGGWGESLLSYKNPSEREQGGDQGSTPSQTAWALMEFLAHLPHTGPSIERGIQYLVTTQVDGSWPENVYTGTGFPNHFFLGYDYYRLYFPMMALGRYRAAVCKG